MFKSKESLLEAIIRCIPYPHQMSDIGISTEDDSIRFKWRSSHFRVSILGSVEEIGDGVLIGSDITIMFEKVLKQFRLMDMAE